MGSKKYTIIILLIVLFIQSITPALAAEEEVVWEDDVTFTFSWSSREFPKSGYIIRVSDFDGEGLVGLEILKDGTIVDRPILSNGTYWNYDDKIKLQGFEITNKNKFPPFGLWPSNPKAEIKIWTGKPIEEDEAILSLGISTANNYKLDSDIKLNVSLKNTGDKTARNVKFVVNIGELRPKNDDYKLSYNYWSIDGDSTNGEEVILKFPLYPKKSSYPVSVNASWSDSNGTIHTIQKSITINVATPITIRKNIGSDEIGIGDQVYVSVSATNTQSRNVHVVLTDSIPNNFQLIEGDENLTWEFDLPAGDFKVFKYTLLPQIPGKLKIPAASATWNLWGNDIRTNSNTPSITIHGPYIYVTKTLNSEKASTTLNVQKNNLIDVNVKMENIGDLPVEVTITDVLPKYALLIENENVLTHNEHIQPGESVEFNYTMKIIWESISNVQVPEPTIQLSMPSLLEDINGYENAYNIAEMPTMRAKYITELADEFTPSTTKSDTKITDPIENDDNQNEINNETQSEELDHIKEVIMPGFEGIFAVLMLFIIFYLKRES